MFKAEYIFVRILFPFIFGIGIFHYYATEQNILILVILAILLFIGILAINIFYRNFSAYRFKGFTGILTFLLFFVLGGLLCLLNNEKLKSDYFTKYDCSHLKVRIVEEPEKKGNIWRCNVSVLSGYKNMRQVKLSGKLLLALRIDSLHPINLKYGDELIIAARFGKVEPPYNPAEFDFSRWLAHKNIYEQAFTHQPNCYKIDQNSGSPIIKFAIALRQKQISVYRKLIHDDEAFAVASTLILGYRADLDQETLNAYSKSGTIHALSVSGSHVAIIFYILNFCFGFLKRNQLLKIFKLLLICSIIWAYALITGLSPSVVRSAIMITIFIVSNTFTKNRNAYNTLAFAAFCQLIYDPFYLWDVGFQLSYLSVFGLIYLQPKIYNWFYIKNKWLNKVWEAMAISLAAQIVTFPLVIYYFHQFPVYFLLGNLFIAIPLVVVMVLGIAILIPILKGMAPILEWTLVSINAVLKWIAGLPYSSISTLWISLPEFLLLSLALGLFIYALAKFNKFTLMASLIFYTVYSFMITYDGWIAVRQKKVIFYSLRKNYAAAFITGRYAILVTDLKETDKNFQFFIKPSLQKSQIEKNDFIDIKRDTAIGQFVKKNNQISFSKYKILIINKDFNYCKVAGKGNFNALWLTDNYKFNPENFAKEIHYKLVLMDATNKDYQISATSKIAENNNISLYVLKKNPAYLVNLNPL